MAFTDRFMEVAKSKIWANQHADRHAIIELCRLTTRTGVIEHLSLPFLETHMPDSPGGVSYFVVYEAGAYEKDWVGVDNVVFDWIPLSNIITVSKSFVMLFIKNRMLNLDSCYLRKSNNGTLLVAIDRVLNKQFLMDDSPAYLRFYSNVDSTLAGYSSVHDYNTINVIGSNYVSWRNGTFIPYKNNVNKVINGNESKVFAFINGFLLPDFFPASMANLPAVLNVQYFTDPKVKNTIRIDYNDFVPFYSEIDDCDKYLMLSHDVNDYTYCDDIEFFVCGYVENTITGEPITDISYGEYLPRLHPNRLRPITAKDWSIKKSDWIEITNNLQKAIVRKLTNFFVYVVVRDSGNQFKYINDSNRTLDLMSLPVDYRKVVYTNTDPTLEFWRVEKVEACKFNQWMGLTTNELTLDAIKEVFSSYGAIDALEGIHYNKVNDDYRFPYLNAMDTTSMIHFDSDGYKVFGVTNSSADPDTVIPGITRGNEIFLPLNQSGNLDTLVDIGDHTTTIAANYGVFCYYFNGGTLEYAVYGRDYTFSNTVITWKSHMYDFTRYVRQTNKYIKFAVELTDVLIRNGIDIYDGREMLHDVGMGKCLVWYKGKYLIEDIDYVVYNSKIFLTSKSLDSVLDDSPSVNEDLEVIYYGLPHSSLRHTNSDESGWIAHTKMSFDNHYDVFNNRHRMISVGGKVLTRDQIFSQEWFVDFNDGAGFTNGLPWTVVKLPIFGRIEEYEIYTQSVALDEVLDNRIEGYLTENFTVYNDTSPTTIVDRYDLFSPFLNKIITLVANGSIVISGTLTEEEVETKVENHLYMLHFDPVFKHYGNTFVDFHPMWTLDPITMSSEELAFIRQVNDYYLNGRVKGINKYITVA